MSLSLRENDIVAEVSEEITPVLTKDLINRAKQAEWPEEVVAQMAVEVIDGAVSVTYPQEISEKIEDLEYGRTTTFPNPVLRPFANSSAIKIQQALERAYIKFIDNGGGLW